MKSHRWLVLVNLLVISWVMVRYLTIRYPSIGGDYGLAFPSLLDSALHFRLNGLSIQWYTPSFAGGMPAYPDPNNTQFSLWTLLTLILQPLQAVIWSTVIYIGLGGLAAYYFLRRNLRLDWSASILGMVFYSANGFMMERLAIGHLGYTSFPMLVFILIILLDPRLPRLIAGFLFSLIVAVFIQQAGYYLLIIFGLSLLMVLPLVYIYRPEVVSWKRIVFITGLGAGVALVLSISKISAVYAFTRNFPRLVADYYSTNPMRGLLGIVLQLLGTMTLAPGYKLLGLSVGSLPGFMVRLTGAQYGYWEFDMSILPLAFGIILIGLAQRLGRPVKFFQSIQRDRKWIAVILLLSSAWLTVEFILARGLVYPLIRQLPGLSSLHVNPRFTAAFLLPMAILAAILFNGWATRWNGKNDQVLYAFHKWKIAWSERRKLYSFLALNVLALLPLGAYFLTGTDFLVRNYDVSGSIEISTRIRSGESLPISAIASTESNTDALILQVSNIDPYVPIFGLHLEYFHPEIKVGSIWQVTDGYFNLTNPSGYVFPGINHTRPFERIPVNQAEEMLVFSRHGQPDWKLPLYQEVFDWISGLSSAAAGLLVVIWGAERLGSSWSTRIIKKGK